ncbi:MAG: universal stress protein [Gemmatimonadota bacterium]
MLNISKILFPTDFSVHAQDALPYAIELAKRYDSELHFLHLQVLHGAQRMDSPDVFPGEEEARKQLAGHAEATDGIRVSHQTQRAINASTGVLAYAQDNDIDVIVMGAHGRRGLRRFLLGSVVEEVLRFSHVPVLIVRNDKSRMARSAISRILVPIDFSRHTQMSLDVSADLARAYRAELCLLHVVAVPTYPDFYVPASGSSLNTARIRQEARDRIQELAKGMQPDIAVETDVRIGQASSVVSQFALDKDFDLIVMPTHSYSGLERVLLGSVTELVVRNAPCPVLTLKPFGKDLRDSLSEELEAQPAEEGV